MKKHSIFQCVLCLFIVFCSCNTNKKPTLFSIVENSNIQFNNALVETKEFNVFKYRNFYNGGGVASGDLNNDGLPELFFTANQGANKLFLNKGNLKFEDISTKAGFANKEQWSTGVVFVDINADGWLDIYVCNAGQMLNKALRKNQLYINNHNLTFTESAAQYGLDNDGYSTQASFFDYDLDGDLDCFLVNNSPIPVNTLNYENMRNIPEQNAPFADFLKGGGDHLFRNDQGKFVDVTKQAGIYGSIISFGLGVTVGDVNQDGWPDVYVSNDFFEKDYLYINQKNGTFKDEIETRTQHISYSSMGADLQDINNDGKPDIFTTDMLPDDDYRLKTNTSFEGYEIFNIKQQKGFYNQYTQNSLQVNNGEGKFLETGFFSGVAASDWSWGALMFDADNDGWSDIFVCNGIYRDVTDQDFIDFFANDVVNQMAISGKKEDIQTVIDKMPSVPVSNKMFRNHGDLHFSDESIHWGLDKPSFSNGAVYSDLDNDGDYDIVINNVNQPASIYRNNTRENKMGNYIALQLQYQHPNNFAIGSVIKLFQHGQVISRELIPSKGFQSSIEYKLTIGIGNNKPDSIQIIWPNNTYITIQNPTINQLLKINYSAATVKPYHYIINNASLTVLQKLPAKFDKHQEDDYVDFYTERNLLFMLSKQGPKAAVGDVNGDGQDDVFIGGAVKQPGQLYIQNAASFTKKLNKDFEKFSFIEATAAFFFDADQDKDLDLFVGGGGNFAPVESGVYQNQLYINDGKGNFTLKAGTFPTSNTNCGTAISVDYDNDGKLDVFVGSRSVPQNYGAIPESFLYHNEGNGIFSDVSESVAPEFKNLGMITGADWSDFNNDGKKELLIIGEWMSPKLYSFNGTKMKSLPTGLENNLGWWQHLNVADLDNDGDLDLLLGNIGENFYLKPTEKEPVKLWMNDFDQNGTPDKIVSRTIGNRDVSVFLKKEIAEQIPSIKKGNLTHQEFAKKSIQELFKDEINTSKTLKVNIASSVIAINNGKGNFTLMPLPTYMQLSSLNASAIIDLDGDGLLDIVTGGNFTDLLPQFCSVDASYGNVLMNKGKNSYALLSSSASGLSLQKQIRDLKSININRSKNLLFLQNNDMPVLFKINTLAKKK